MSKIVAVMGSANGKGNTAAAVDAILDGAMGLSTNYIRYHDLSKLNFVKACDFTAMFGKGVDGVQDPELKTVMNNISSADVILFATPLYFNFPTAQFSMILDSMSCFLNKDGSALAGKKAIVLVTCDNVDEYSKGALNGLVNAVEKLQMTIVSKLIYSCGGKKFKDDKAAVDKAIAIGAKFFKTSDVEPESELVILG